VKGGRAVALHIHRRTLFGLLAAAAAGVLVLVLTRPDPTVAVLVAEGPLPAGVELEGLPIGVRHLPDTAGLVAADSPDGLADWTLAAPLAAGEPLLPSLLRPPERRDHPDILALSLPRDRAVLGELQAGDLVDVYVTADALEGPPATRLVAADLYVVAAGPAPGGIAGSEGIDLLLAVDDTLAAALVSARHEGEIDLVRVSR
jgi:Flp pilus assembly protein CpaB